MQQILAFLCYDCVCDPAFHHGEKVPLLLAIQILQQHPAHATPLWLGSYAQPSLHQAASTCELLAMKQLLWQSLRKQQTDNNVQIKTSRWEM
jgi:hypothetical protein